MNQLDLFAQDLLSELKEAIEMVSKNQKKIFTIERELWRLKSDKALSKNTQCIEQLKFWGT